MIIKYSEGSFGDVIDTSKNDNKDKFEKLTLEAFEKQKNENDDDLKKEAAASFANSTDKPFWANKRK